MKRDLGLSVIMLGGAVLLLAGVVGMMLYLHNSLVDAVNEVCKCEYAGGIECHIEREGFDYNVYWRGEMK